MWLTVLGCRAGMPADGQASSGYLLETGTSRLLLDCGPGIATALSSVVRPAGLDAIVISHFHSDHCYDLLPIGKALLSDFAHEPGACVERLAESGFAPVQLFVPRGSGDLLARWAGLFPVRTFPMLDKAFELAFDVHEYAPGEVHSVGDAELTMHEMRHAIPTCGVRVESPTGTFAYTGDTGMTPALYDLAADVDVLLAEATLAEPETGDHGHLSGADTGVVAAKAGVGRLVLTHFASADEDDLEGLRSGAAESFDGPIQLAEPGARIGVGG
ncbi:MBL fold metallo-hydrolase [Saccharopolyspora indica]|uniref:MBL fold metallo-hydrolase n=1 Tax=Saccharopolyspora indica TaxID=1229659 RepID=UPI0022EAE033|nr:MBL fold metallo-hydrolase [Saccharopolyspora indica]MDA3648391.1 MBL fold metallo-hydrolase [Saccharopolyspora indica]